MKTRNFLLSGILGIALAGFVLTGCHKASSNPDTDYTAAQDETNGSMAANDTKGVSDAAMQGNSGKYGPVHDIHSIYTTDCTVYADTGISGTDTIRIVFGDGVNPVYCKDYRYRKGTIIVYWPSSAGFALSAYYDSGATITETFKNYAVGKTTGTMYGIAGSRTWTNQGNVSLNGENWKFTANLSITNPSGKIFTWTSIRYNTLKEVGTTWYYEVTGSATGVTETGVTYTLDITSPLYVTALPWWWGGCAWIESGIVTINRSTSTNTLTINFGSIGNCDDQATATLNGNSYPITMW